jgi:tetratricopeptide (TPR) repeat protein
LYSKLIPVDWKKGGQLVTSAATHIDILCNLGLVYQSSQQFDIASEYLQQGLSAARKNGKKKAEATTLFYIARGHDYHGYHQITIKCLEDSLAISQEIADYEIEYQVSNKLGYFNYYNGNYDLAISYFSQALKVAFHNSFTEGEALAFANLANTYIGVKKYDLAINYFNQYIAIISHKQEPIKCTTYLLNLVGNFCANIHKYKTVITWVQEPLKNYMNEADKHEDIYPIKGLVAAHNGLEEYQKFFDTLSECIKLESDGNSRDKANKVYNLGKKFQEIRKIEQAIENIQSSEMLLNNIDHAGGDSVNTLKVLIELAKTLLKCVIGIQPMMQYYLNQAEEICKELQLPLLTEIQKIQAYLQEN